MRSHSSPHQYQVNLDDEPLGRNKEFARQIGTLNLGAKYHFDYLNCNESIARQRDQNMTLDHFLDLMDEKIWVRLHIESHLSPEIRFAVCNVHEPNDRHTERLLFYDFPYSDERLQRVETLFQQVYQKPLWTAQDKSRFMESLNEKGVR